MKRFYTILGIILSIALVVQFYNIESLKDVARLIVIATGLIWAHIGYNNEK